MTSRLAFVYRISADVYEQGEIWCYVTCYGDNPVTQQPIRKLCPSETLRAVSNTNRWEHFIKTTLTLHGLHSFPLFNAPLVVCLYALRSHDQSCSSLTPSHVSVISSLYYSNKLLKEKKEKKANKQVAPNLHYWVYVILRLTSLHVL